MSESWLITGGTGALGRRLVGRLLADPAGPRRVCVFSRDEHKQAAMARSLGQDGLAPDDRVRFMLGDVRDVARLTLAMRGVDVVVHAAALKVVPALEYNPSEAVRTNVDGASHVIAAALANNVHRVVAVSSDKAAAPVNLYGATKLTAERLFAAAGAYSAGRTRFASVRYGNVTLSTGSVVPLWRDCVERGDAVPVTNPQCTRFWMTLDQAVDVVLDAVARIEGGETRIPRLPSYLLGDLVEAVAPGAEIECIGLRAGEKLHESLIAEDEAPWAWLDGGSGYVLRPGGAPRGDAGGAYRSDGAERLNVAELRARLAGLAS